MNASADKNGVDDVDDSGWRSFIEQDKVYVFRWYVEGDLDGAKIKPLVHIVETTM